MHIHITFGTPYIFFTTQEFTHGFTKLVSNLMEPCNCVGFVNPWHSILSKWCQR